MQGEKQHLFPHLHKLQQDHSQEQDQHHDKRQSGEDFSARLSARSADRPADPCGLEFSEVSVPFYHFQYLFKKKNPVRSVPIL
jgi:hypothetical protein